LGRESGFRLEHRVFYLLDSYETMAVVADDSPLNNAGLTKFHVSDLTAERF